jgi:hypothetical protein
VVGVSATADPRDPDEGNDGNDAASAPVPAEPDGDEPDPVRWERL